MSQIESQIRLIQEKLANDGSSFTYEEIEEVFSVLKQASLKLIVTNVPVAVFSEAVARNAFEDHFKSYDDQSTFVYLSSFNRAQVYMKRPEAALCARLQSQGWKLPDGILSKLTGDTTDIRLSEGINCFIDHIDEDDGSATNSTEDESDEVECTCGLGTDTVPLGDDNQAERVSESYLNQGLYRGNESTGKMGPKEASEDFVASMLLSGHPAPSTGSESACTTLRSIVLKDLSTDYRVSTAERESPSEASGDDLITSVAAATAQPYPHKAFCPKYHRKKAKTEAGMKHLAPPKPSRLFLLSPPASPPVGWEPKPECEPIINYELLEALAALAPGEAFELHPRDETRRHPSIVITPCETHQSVKARPPIVQTRCPERKT